MGYLIFRLSMKTEVHRFVFVRKTTVETIVSPDLFRGIPENVPIISSDSGNNKAR